MTHHRTKHRRREHNAVWKRMKNGRITVQPVQSRRGDKIVWDATRTGDGIALFFPDRRLFGRQMMHVKAGQTAKLKVLARNDIVTVYPYAIFFLEWHTFGQGSSPIIIVRE